jgi:hypothetical protein
MHEATVGGVIVSIDAFGDIPLSRRDRLPNPDVRNAGSTGRSLSHGAGPLLLPRCLTRVSAARISDERKPAIEDLVDVYVHNAD